MQQFGEFIGNHFILWSLFLALSVMMIWSLLAGFMSGVKQLNASQFTRSMNGNGVIVVDVREKDAYGKGHILNARNIPVSALQGRLDEFKDHQDETILVYCQTGNTSLRAGKMLQESGCKNVFSLQGGMVAWQEAKLPLTTD